MKCLRKYEWVKLQRSNLPKGKGIMASWAKLASRAAFRKGTAVYCGYNNAVEPGMWSGGIVGVKSILGTKSRSKACEVLQLLSNLGYIQYNIDSKTKKLTYEIVDWVIRCSGQACINGAVYTTNDYGFLCVPRNITERLVRNNYVFEESDAWLDLWCHTVMNDPKNAFSYLAPSVQYGKYGTALSLETLGKRWRWEKTKVWRFFKKYRDTFPLYKLPGSFGCLIFNAGYPSDVCSLPDYEDVVRIFDEIRLISKNEHNNLSNRDQINRAIAWYSVRLQGKEQKCAEESAEMRVALLAPIYRAYLSLCRNRKNCRYDCKSIDICCVEISSIDIRGPCLPVDFKSIGEEILTMSYENDKQDYQEQEDMIRTQSDKFIELLTKRGVIEDKTIQNVRIREAQKERRKIAYHNTLLLLKQYRNIAWMMECFPETVAEELDMPFSRLDDLIDRVDLELSMGDKKLESRMESVRKSRILIDRINEALTVLRKKPEDGERLYELIHLTYIAPEKLPVCEIQDKMNISARQYYRIREQAITILSIRLWSSPDRNLDCWLDMLTLLET